MRFHQPFRRVGAAPGVEDELAHREDGVKLGGHGDIVRDLLSGSGGVETFALVGVDQRGVRVVEEPEFGLHEMREGAELGGTIARFIAVPDDNFNRWTGNAEHRAGLSYGVGDTNIVIQLNFVHVSGV